MPSTKPVEVLPLEPRITPALSIGGVVLLLTGIVYALIGVKNRWVHVFLSTAYLASLAVLVLILYVLNPPVSNAVQGAYFVGILMSGLIFGGGALVFKEVTEGLGCLLGGFCLSMWLLTLKEGGLMTSTGGKAIFIAVFAVVCWSLSFSHYTRPYGLIGSTSFSGATSFVLGIDCFSRGGYKEFWVYIWGLNEDLFPLNTHTYPITRGIRVEIVVIVLGTIIGVISQIRLWKVVKDRQKERAEAQADDDRRRDAVEEALGRHLERQNDRDRSEWEKRYGDRLNAKRTTVLWSETHGENKRFSSASTTEVGSSQNSESNESLEMSQMQNAATRLPMHSSSKSKRQSAISVQPIQEVEEEEHRNGYANESKHNDSLPQMSLGKFSFDRNATASPGIEQQDMSKTRSKDASSPDPGSQSLKPQGTKPSSRKTADRLQTGETETKSKKRSSMQSLNDLIRSKSPLEGEKAAIEDDFSESKEKLVRHSGSVATRSRASSVAATMDEENEKLDMPPLDFHDDSQHNGRLPPIVISSHNLLGNKSKPGFNEPPSPSGLSDSFEEDPEALMRPPTAQAHGFEYADGHRTTNGLHIEGAWEDGPKSANGASQASSAEGLTKGALERVPSQMSNVVLSYRTNEWAKHIASADAPLHEEPEPIADVDTEAPTHLADPKLLSPTQETGPEQAAKTPPLPSPITSVAPSEAGVKVNPEIQPIEPVKPQPSPQIEAVPKSEATSPNPGVTFALPSPSAEAPVRSPSAMSTQNAAKRSFTDPTQQPSTTQAPQVPSKSSRRISNPMQRPGSVLQNHTIHENFATDFGRPGSALQRNFSNASAANLPFYNSPNASQIDLNRSNSNVSIQQFYPSAFQRGPSFDMQFNRSQPDLRPSSSHSQSPYGMQGGQAIRSETRLSDYGKNSHQPLSRNNTNDSKRESLMAGWRHELAQSRNNEVVPYVTADSTYVQQMADYGADKMRREQARQNQARQEAYMDQTMRTQSMIDAHREVMKKMQREANKKLGK